MSFRDVEDLLAERGITVSYEAVRGWCQKFAADYARRLRKRQGRLGDSWHVDELFVRINGQQQYLWRAVDQDGDVIDILLQPHRDRRAAERFFQRLLRREGKEPLRIITDRLKSYGAALRTMLPHVAHDTGRYANNRAEVSHQHTRQREQKMRRFKSRQQAAIFERPRTGPKSLSCWTTSIEILELPLAQIAILYGLEIGNCGVDRLRTTADHEVKATAPLPKLTIPPRQ
jgi:putative transposase